LPETASATPKSSTSIMMYMMMEGLRCCPNWCQQGHLRSPHTSK
jgi:hypothetical protein